MNTLHLRAGAAAALAIGIASGALLTAQQQPAPQPFAVGNGIGLPIAPAADGTFNPVSPNVKVYGAIYSAESCSYDPVRNLIVVPNRGVAQTVQTNNAWVSLINHDGSVHTARWIGVQNPGAQRDNLNPKLVLNEPYGSDIVKGVLYLADRDGGTTPAEPSVAVVRRFTMTTGAPAGETRVEGAPWFNDLEVADDGTTYATVTGAADAATSWQVWKITPDGKPSVFVAGRAAPAAERRRHRSARQRRRRQHGDDRVADVLAGRQAAQDRKRRADRQRRARHHARRHQVREQRDEWRRVADSARPAGGTHRAKHSQRRVDVLRRRGRISS